MDHNSHIKNIRNLKKHQKLLLEIMRFKINEIIDNYPNVNKQQIKKILDFHDKHDCVYNRSNCDEDICPFCESGMYQKLYDKIK